MAYVLTIWLIWPTEAVLVKYEATSCTVALNEVMAVAAGDGVTQYRVVKCELMQEA